ncbi:MAG TPA: hypothetical protein PKA82_04785 [Pyrinomonadaceae bacterium]|nr:hypothetical protein [Pyrinomonadaceae bacterium]
MRNIILIAVAMIAFAVTTSVVVSKTEAAAAASFKLVNDTDGDVQIHTGSGFVEINKSSSTSITCDAGREIRLANKGKKGDVLFVVDESMCGKTVKLSKYL